MLGSGDRKGLTGILQSKIDIRHTLNLCVVQLTISLHFWSYIARCWVVC